jgi:hypothetical protein
MNIYLHNPSHNGDHLFTLEMLKILIRDNLDKNFVIVPACSMYLFNDLLSDHVRIEKHPVIWDESKNIFLDNNLISNSHDILWSTHDGNIYINMWKLLIHNNPNCISLANRVLFIKNTLDKIYEKTNIRIKFNCEDYKELIPILPTIDIDNIKDKLNQYNKKVVFFYNQDSKSGCETFYIKNFNEETIKKLLHIYGEDYIILLSKPCNIKNKRLINVEDEFNVKPSVDGKNLIINANIANLCDEVYFKANGGSLFLLNQIHINNSKQKLKYHYLGANNYYDIIINEYELRCSYNSL